MQFRLSRDGEDVFFSSWADYLKARASGKNRSLSRVLAVNNRDFAKAERDQLQRELTEFERTFAKSQRGPTTPAQAHERIEKEAREKMEKARERHRLAQARAGLAWLTPILGSGCLDKGSETDRQRACSDVALVIQAASTIDPDHPLLSDGTPIGVAVERFASELAAAHGFVAAKSNSGEVEERHVIAAHAVLSAFLLTRLHIACLDHSLGPLPGERDGVPVPQGSAPVARAAEQIRLQSLSALDGLSASLASDDRSFIDALIEQIRQTLAQYGRKRATSRAGYVDVLTELAWHLIIRETGQYSGWRDLFTALSIRTEVADPKMRSPYFRDMSDVSGWLFDELKAITDNSWAARRDGETSPRSEFFDVVASMLARQAQLNGMRAEDARDRYPRAVAFVTGFDVELEQALLATATIFDVIAPFRYIVDGRYSGLVWLRARVTPSGANENAPERLRQLTNWEIVDSHNHPLDKGVPTIVRLSGSPLMGVPDLTADMALNETLERRMIAGQAIAARIEHALVIDEHTGLHQWTADLRLHKSRSDGLPDELLNGGVWAPRFWVLLGVQIRDHAIRHRVAATISTTALRASAADGTTLRRQGVAVIRHSGPTDREILHWRSIDVVESDFTELTDEIATYTAQLEHPDSWSKLEGTR